MNVVFLDFDGVLNSHRYMQRIGAFGEPTPTEEEVLDPEAVAHLNRLVLAVDADVVISSSWRYGRTTEHLTSMLEARGFQGRVVDKLPDWSKDELRGLYVAEERGDEIREWLAKHPEVTAFVVLDDGTDMTAVAEHHVQTSLFGGGLGAEHIDQALGLFRAQGVDVL